MSASRRSAIAEGVAEAVLIPIGRDRLEGVLDIPAGAPGLVLFAHGSGSSRHSPRNRFVAEVIRASGNGTLLFDLLTPEEGSVDQATAAYRFDMVFLAGRLLAATRWVSGRRDLSSLAIGYFGSSSGGGAALVAAAEQGDAIGAVVSRGGRVDLAGDALPRVLAPTLLIVGEYDEDVLRLNEDAYGILRCERALEVIPHATHLFEEPGALEDVAERAASWFERHLCG